MNSEQRGRGLNVLLVQDDPGDLILTRTALMEAQPLSDSSGAGSESWIRELVVAGDGREALDLLGGEEGAKLLFTPNLILLDLNMPRMDGRAFLEIAKAHPKLRRIPVIVLTTSGAEEDIQACYDLQANCFITKPVDFIQFAKVVKSIKDFWFDVAQLPQSGEA